MPYYTDRIVYQNEVLEYMNLFAFALPDWYQEGSASVYKAVKSDVPSTYYFNAQLIIFYELTGCKNNKIQRLISPKPPHQYSTPSYSTHDSLYLSLSFFCWKHKNYSINTNNNININITHTVSILLVSITLQIMLFSWILEILKRWNKKRYVIMRIMIIYMIW